MSTPTERTTMLYRSTPNASSITPTAAMLWDQASQGGLRGQKQRAKFVELMVKHGHYEPVPADLPVISLSRAAKELGVERTFLKGLAQQGVLHGFKVNNDKGVQSFVFTQVSLEAVIARMKP